MGDRDSDLDLPQQPVPEQKKRRKAQRGGDEEEGSRVRSTDIGGNATEQPVVQSEVVAEARGKQTHRRDVPRCVHILAFGDSLTAGGFGSRPYPAQLQALLNERSSSGEAYKVHNAGICGESTEDMVERLRRELRDFRSDGICPAFVLVLGGTNDLGHMTPQQILCNVAKLRQIAHQAQAIPVALAIPRDEFGLGPVARLVNRGLRAEASGHNLLLADVSSVSGEHLSDGVHFTSEGYALFAQLAFDAMRPKLALAS
mmetsp:Transcript_68404/g.222522  ORF Transcript_68404/g.222522 Transcript_68404/m.222522 type:complete len:257 (+) Transcript_68404:61-831(+)